MLGVRIRRVSVDGGVVRGTSANVLQLNGLSSSPQTGSWRRWFRRFDSGLKHFKITGNAFEIVQHPRGASSTQNTGCCRLLANLGRAKLSRNLADGLSPNAHLFGTRNGHTSGVDEGLPFIRLVDRHWSWMGEW